MFNQCVCACRDPDVHIWTTSKENTKVKEFKVNSPQCCVSVRSGEDKENSYFLSIPHGPYLWTLCALCVPA